MRILISLVFGFLILLTDVNSTKNSLKSADLGTFFDKNNTSEAVKFKDKKRIPTH